MSTENVTFDSENDGIYIIDRGVWKVINRHDNYEVTDNLSHGDFWGEAEALKICDYTHYGDIYAVSDVKLFFISYEDFETLPIHELEMITENISDRHSDIQYTLSRRYGVDVNWFRNLMENPTTTNA